MRYLLIDIGASYIKKLIYDTSTDSHQNIGIELSPFKINNTINKNDILNIIELIICKSVPIDGVIFCTILGGGWIGDEYYSWKSSDPRPKLHCLISGLFSDISTYHIHKHHGGNVNGLHLLGHIRGTRIYSSLGDTNCVLESIDFNEHETIINIGTGSQVINRTKDNTTIVGFIPAGRSFLVFDKFFESIGFDFFGALGKITADQVYSSTMDIDLKTFPESKNFSVGGKLDRIVENHFTITNLLASILRCFVLQYRPYIDSPSKKIIRLVGGIPHKLPILSQLFEQYYPKFTIITEKSSISNTHMGMIQLIKRHLL